MQITIRRIPAHDPAAHRADATTARAQERDAMDRAESGAKASGCTPQDMDDWQARRVTEVGVLRLADYAVWARAAARHAAKAKSAELLAARPATSDSYEIIADRSYDHREALKGRGYRFGGGGTGKAWVRKLATTAEVEAEIADLKAIDPALTARSEGFTERLIGAVVEGRSDLI